MKAVRADLGKDHFLTQIFSSRSPVMKTRQIRISCTFAPSGFTDQTRALLFAVCDAEIDHNTCSPALNHHFFPAFHLQLLLARVCEGFRQRVHSGKRPHLPPLLAFRHTLNILLAFTCIQCRLYKWTAGGDNF